MAVDVEELEGSPTYSYDRGSGEAVRRFKMAWDDVGEFIEEILPSPYLDGTTVVVPEAAVYPGADWLYASKVAMEPFGKPEGLNEVPIEYSYAIVTVTYTTGAFDQAAAAPPTDGPGGVGGATSSSGPVGPAPTTDSGAAGEATTFVSHSVTMGGEFMSWPNAALQYGSPDVPLTSREGGMSSEDVKTVPEDQMVGVIMPTIEHSITWHFCPFPNWKAIRRMIGHVNAYWFCGCPPETMLFVGCEASRETTNTGIRAWSLTMKFAERNIHQVRQEYPIGWNHFLRANGFGIGQWSIIDRKAPLMYAYLAEDMAEPAVGETTPFSILPGRGRFINGYCEHPAGLWFITTKVSNWEVMQLTAAGQMLRRRREDPAGTTFAHTAGNHIQQIIFTRLVRAVTLRNNWIHVAALADESAGPGGFPEVGQFFILVEKDGSFFRRERMLVVERKPAPLIGTRQAEYWRVLRGVRNFEYTAGHYMECRTLSNPYVPVGTVVPDDPGELLDSGRTGICTHSVGDWVWLEKMPLYPMEDFRYLFTSGLTTR